MNETPLETHQSETKVTIPMPPQTNRDAGLAHNYFVIVCGIIALLLLGFIGGQNFERARIRHFAGWTNNYERNFFDNKPLPPMKMMERGLPPDSFRSYSFLGKILTVESKKISVQDDRSNQEQAVIISDSTAIRYNDSSIDATNLKPDQKVAIFGRPNNDGQIVASLIRVLDNSFVNIQSPSADVSSNNQP